MVESCSPGDYPRFGRLPQATIEEKAAKLKKWIWEKDSDVPRDRLAVSEDCILDITGI